MFWATEMRDFRPGIFRTAQLILGDAKSLKDTVLYIYFEILSKKLLKSVKISRNYSKHKSIRNRNYNHRPRHDIDF